MRSRRRYGCLGGAAFVSMVEATKSQNICPQATDPSRRLLHPVLGGEHRQQSDPQPCDGAGRVAGPRPRSRGSRVGYRVGWTRQAVPARPEGWIAASSGNRSFIKKGTYVEYYQRSRAHLVLDKDAHVSRPVASAAEGGDIVVIPRSVACTTGTNAAPRRSRKGSAMPPNQRRGGNPAEEGAVPLGSLPGTAAARRKHLERCRPQ